MTTTYDMIADMEDTIHRAIKEEDSSTLYVLSNAVAEQGDEEKAFFLRKTAMKLDQLKWRKRDNL